MADFVVLNWRLDLSCRGLQQLDPSALVKCCKVAEHVDLSKNQFQALEFLAGFDRLQTLICDHNAISSLRTLPLLKQLDTLSLNFNCIQDLEGLQDLAGVCPALTHLSLMGNPCCPLFSSSASEDAYECYRREVAYCLPQLLLLDGTALKKEFPERSGGEGKQRLSSFEECEIAEWPKV